MPNDEKQNWEAYKARELAGVLPLLTILGFSIDDDQPHTEGERYLLLAVTTASGRKLILLGRENATGRRVVIKVASETDGMREIAHERLCRNVLSKIDFAYTAFLSPEEILFTKKGGYLISIQEFVEQDQTFLSRPIEEQFTFALRAFKAQEGAHATTYEHARHIRTTFGSTNHQGYLERFSDFRKNIEKTVPDDRSLRALLAEGEETLKNGIQTIEQYEGFLTHTDFVPHNFRIRNNDIYLLDYSSLRFGNKYEGWARFVNFMTLYNPPLASVLFTYVRENRTPEESISLKLMRIYRLGEIIWYYTRALDKSAGDLHTLTTARVALWAHILDSVLHDTPLSEEVLQNYRELRDTLRSPEERHRQIDLH